MVRRTRVSGCLLLLFSFVIFFFFCKTTRWIIELIDDAPRPASVSNDRCGVGGTPRERGKSVPRPEDERDDRSRPVR